MVKWTCIHSIYATRSPESTKRCAQIVTNGNVERKTSVLGKFWSRHGKWSWWEEDQQCTRGEAKIVRRALLHWQGRWRKFPEGSKTRLAECHENARSKSTLAFPLSMDPALILAPKSYFLPAYPNLYALCLTQLTKILIPIQQLTQCFSLEIQRRRRYLWHTLAVVSLSSTQTYCFPSST